VTAAGLTDAEVAIAAAEAGAAVVRARFGTALERYDKSGLDFATDADVSAERAILDALRAARPDDGFLGEELGTSGPELAGRRWLVDPLCGTLNFAAGTPLVAVNVALSDRGAVEVAAAADPFAGEVFWTAERAAFVRRDGHDERLLPSSATRLVDVDLDGPSPEDPDQFHLSRILTDPGFIAAFQPRVLSTTLALAWVAAGRRLAYLSSGALRDSVHCSPGIALCQAAGCVVTGLRGQPLHTGVGGLVAAADEQAHAALVEIVNRQFG
jgi:myo-inositol-1(or 4)-monophosphatase